MTEEMNRLTMELVEGAIDKTLTEERYNEILDVLIPPMPDSLEGYAVLILCGKQEWQERRFQRLKATKSAA